MAVESEVHHESSEEYDSEEYEDDEEVLDTEHIDVEMEEVDFKTQGKERCKDAFLNFSSDYEDNEADEDNDLVDEDEEGFGSEEEIDDTAGANDLDLGDTVGAGFPIHDPSVKWNKMKPFLGERYESPHELQQCLTNYAIKSGYNIKFAKCDTVRLTAKCGYKMKSQPCPFRVHASWMTQERVIGLDGSFLKGTCKGELLTAIGRDANNQVYPIAWLVVDIENKANWKWFLELLIDDLNLLNRGGFTVISDQHKGLLEETKKVLPNVEHR
ncbi:unnamed protein product [Lactuca saligna]|uniref:MULE transposase domain-containing protein n=1 Tax=Lactuca saligna TaxID=75948 RepID=A0AA35ZDS4_LACSI|nr:unnamed protein product [Lactuca saligna]